MGLLVQFSPAAGRAGRCRQISLCVGSTPRVPAALRLPRTGVSVLSPSALLSLPAALYGAAPALSAVRFRVLHKSADSVLPACCVFPGLSGSGSQGLGRTFPGCGAPFPSAASGSGSQGLGRTRAFSLRGPSARRHLGLRKSLDGNREPGPVCRVGGGGFSGAEFAPFPSPCLLPPVGMGRLFSGVSQSLCFANRRRCVPAG